MRTLCLIVAMLAFGPRPAHADAALCQTVKLADVGWADVTATTAIAGVILKGLGYTPRIDPLTVDGTLKGLQSHSLDVFLGAWLPALEPSLKPYLATKAIEQLRLNLTDGKFTLAVPTYTYDKGLHSFADIAAFKDSLGGKIYGLEVGNDGNHLLLDMIRTNRFDLGGFKVVETNEPTLLAEVARATGKGEDMVFLAWAPHPMNAKIKLTYLSGGDAVFGPQYGNASVATVVRAGFVTECPNVGQLFANLAFTSDQEAAPMGWIVDDKVAPREAAMRFLKANPALLDGWLRGVLTFNGQQPGLPAVRALLGL